MYVLNRSILRRYGTLITREGSARYYRLYLPGVINIVSRRSPSLFLSLSLSRARARVREMLMTLDYRSLAWQRVIDCPFGRAGHVEYPSPAIDLANSMHDKSAPRNRGDRRGAPRCSLLAESRRPLFISNEIFNPGAIQGECRAVHSFRGKRPDEQKGQSSSPCPSSSRRSRTEAGANRANSVTTRRGSRGSSAKLSLRTKTTDKTMAAPRCQEVT